MRRRSGNVTGTSVLYHKRIINSSIKFWSKVYDFLTRKIIIRFFTNRDAFGLSVLFSSVKKRVENVLYVYCNNINYILLNSAGRF